MALFLLIWDVIPNIFVDKIKISMKQEKNINPIILTEMKEAVEETGEHILNPYDSLEKFRNDKHYSGGE